jgi:hypothetical protein
LEFEKRFNAEDAEDSQRAQREKLNAKTQRGKDAEENQKILVSSLRLCLFAPLR